MGLPGFEHMLGPDHAFRSLELVPVTPKLGAYFGTDKGLPGRAGLPRARACRSRRATCCRRSRPHTGQPGSRVPYPAFVPAWREGEARGAPQRKQLILDATIPAADAARNGAPRLRQGPPPPPPPKPAAPGPALPDRVSRAGGPSSTGPLLACAAMLRSDFHYELPDELIARIGCPAQRQPPAAPRRPQRRARRFALRRPGEAAAPRRPAGVQRHAGDPRATARPQGHGRQGRTAARARRRPAAAPWCSCARASLRRGFARASCRRRRRHVVGREDDFWLLDFGTDPSALFERHGEMPSTVLRATRRSLTGSATRPSTPACPVPWRHPPQGCISTPQCWRRASALVRHERT